MKDLITNILTNTGSRDAGTVEQALYQQAVASPWANVAEE